MKLECISTKNAPAAVGPYSQAVKAAGLIFVSGQLPLHPQTGEMVGEEAAEQAAQCLHNLLAILESQNLGPSSVVKTTVYLTNINDFDAVNEVYARFFKDHCPARVCFQVAGLPKNAKVEIEAVAAV